VKFISHLLIILAIYSCGAAKNSSRDDGDTTTPDSPDRQIQRFEPGKFQSTTFTNTYRDRGTAQLTILEEISKTISGNLPSTVSQIPQYDRHNDKAVIPVSPLPNLATDCGNSDLSTMTIKARISDCKSKNTDNENSYQWIGENNGISSEGNWFLVANSNDKTTNYQVWVDENTNLVWSDIVSYKADFFKATGTKDGATDYALDRVCQTLDKNPQHALGKIHGSKISWRIPTRNDFLQADLDGSRYVLPNTETLVWTGSYHDNNQAWAIKQSTGELVLTNTADEIAVRCVGIILE